MITTSKVSGTAFRTGASHGAPIEPSRKYAPVRSRYAKDSARRNPQRGQNQNDYDQQSKRNGIPNGRQPRRANRTQQEIRASQKQVRQRQRSSESQAIRHRSAKDCQEPNHSAENAGQGPGLLSGKIQRFAQIIRQ